MSPKSRQRRSPIMLSAVFIIGALVEGAHMNDLHVRVAMALQGEPPLQDVQFVSMLPGDGVKLVRAKCTYQGES